MRTQFYVEEILSVISQPYLNSCFITTSVLIRSVGLMSHGFQANLCFYHEGKLHKNILLTLFEIKTTSLLCITAIFHKNVSKIS